ncbi:protein AF-10 [Lates japonicus]|uniref:Protein AF-10 n=1 Tax=Lates japonicus TaxID=270547 RepID=A0AAD3NMD8_LATJO|nr:protein AF-10 [Lates japonicus]
MVSGERCLAADDGFSTNNMKEMIGGCCVCSDERGWAENPLVYCDGHGCNVAVHQGYGALRMEPPPPLALSNARLRSGSAHAAGQSTALAWQLICYAR